MDEKLRTGSGLPTSGVRTGPRVLRQRHEAGQVEAMSARLWAAFPFILMELSGSQGNHSMYCSSWLCIQACRPARAMRCTPWLLQKDELKSSTPGIARHATGCLPADHEPCC